MNDFYCYFESSFFNHNYCYFNSLCLCKNVYLFIAGILKYKKRIYISFRFSIKINLIHFCLFKNYDDDDDDKVDETNVTLRIFWGGWSVLRALTNICPCV